MKMPEIFYAMFHDEWGTLQIVGTAESTELDAFNHNRKDCGQWPDAVAKFTLDSVSLQPELLKEITKLRTVEDEESGQLQWVIT